MSARMPALFRSILVPALVAALVIVGFSAYSASGSNGGTVYYACVNSRDGGLYNVGTSPTTCRFGHDQISWSQEGPPGQPGEPGISNLTTVEGDPVPITTSGNEAVAACPAGKVAISGGFKTVGDPPEFDPLSIDESSVDPQLFPLEAVFAEESFAVAGTGSDNPFGFHETDLLEPNEYGWFVFARAQTPFGVILLEEPNDEWGVAAIAYCGNVESGSNS